MYVYVYIVYSFSIEFTVYISLYSLYLLIFYEIKIAVIYMYNIFINYIFIEVY